MKERSFGFLCFSQSSSSSSPSFLIMNSLQCSHQSKGFLRRNTESNQNRKQNESLCHIKWLSKKSIFQAWVLEYLRMNVWVKGIIVHAISFLQELPRSQFSFQNDLGSQQPAESFAYNKRKQIKKARKVLRIALGLVSLCLFQWFRITFNSTQNVN